MMPKRGEYQEPGRLRQRYLRYAQRLYAAALRISYTHCKVAYVQSGREITKVVKGAGVTYGNRCQTFKIRSRYRFTTVSVWDAESDPPVHHHLDDITRR